MPKFNNVLLIDDNEVNNLLHERLIEISEFGKSIVVKQSAPEALDYLKSIASDESLFPEIIFLDIRMPIMNGFGFLDEYESMPDGIKSKAKVVMLSSTLDPEDNDRASKNPHVIKMLLKPLTMDQLSTI
ncbi:MAG: response regulator [Pseudomonadota bacterium]